MATKLLRLSPNKTKSSTQRTTRLLVVLLATATPLISKLSSYNTTPPDLRPASTPSSSTSDGRRRSSASMNPDMSIDLSMPQPGAGGDRNNSPPNPYVHGAAGNTPPMQVPPPPATVVPSSPTRNRNAFVNIDPHADSSRSQQSRQEQQMEHIRSEQMNVLQRQGFPIGLANQLNDSKSAHPIRFWVVDNSGSMLQNDGHELRGAGDKVMVVPCTRWAELKSTVTYHAELAALLEATTIFRFLNDPGARAGPQEFSIAENPDTNVIQDLKVARSVVGKTVPKGVTPLTDHLQEIRMRVEAMEDVLVQSGQNVVVVLATDGLPSDGYGDSTELVQQEFIMSLKSLQQLPVWIVVRLCTDDTDVVTYYNDLDSSLELPLEVIDDFLGEAREIQQTNAWLNYTMPLHRCREMGYHHRIFDLLDERLLNKDELREFLELLFGQSALATFPDIHMDWKGFTQQLTKLVADSGKFYNPLVKKLAPWIDMKQLEKCYKNPGGSGGGRGLFRRSRKK